MTNTDVSLVLVAHRSAAVLPATVAAFRAQAGELGLRGEVVVVDHSEDAEELACVAACAPDRLEAQANRGFAAGVNRGLELASGHVILVGNPDVDLLAGGLAALLGALEDGWGVAGPQFELCGFSFPPADEQTPYAELQRRRALGSRRRWERFLAAELARWRRAWEAPGPLAVPTLSGALLAFPASLAARLGPWDEGYFLYFEETDWLRRARRMGTSLALVPGARARHQWGHSARPQRWASQFLASQRRFYRRQHPLFGRLALGWPTGAPPAAAPWSERPARGHWRWLLSPSPAAFPAALLAADRDVEQATSALAGTLGLEEVTLVAWEATGELRGPYRWAPTR